MEIWKTAIYNGEVFENYEVSADGQVRNAKTGRIMKLGKHRGYLTVGLQKDGKQRLCSVHRLVATAFIPNSEPTVKTEVNHIDENKHNNSVENLEWMTPKENANHGTRTERIAKARSKKVIGRSLTDCKVIVFQSTQQAGRFGFHTSHVCSCCNGKLKSHKGYTWKYLD